MRARFSAAIVAFSSQTMVLVAEALQHAAPAVPQEAEAVIEGMEDIQSPTEVVASDSEAEPIQLEDGAQCDFFVFCAADPVSPDRCEVDPHGGQSSTDPMDPAAAPQAKAEGSRPVACVSAYAQEEEFVWISNSLLTTMKWLPLPWNAE